MTDECEVLRLLQQLTWWERQGGMHERPAELASTGEDLAAMGEIRRLLEAAGAQYHWRHETRDYILDTLGAPPGPAGEANEEREPE